MPRKEILDRIQRYIQPFRITKGESFQLKNYDPGDTCGLKLDKGEASELLQQGTEWLAQEQDMLYAQDRWSVLLVFQAMDAAGKDSTIKHVMSGVNPQGCQVFSFKQPSQEDLNHDFMWRYSKCLPERGRIGIFNRSYYEEVLIVRVHEEILKQQKMPQWFVGKRIWNERLAGIAHFEDYLTRQGVIILKFFLQVSREEQKKRFMKRLDTLEKNWKFSASDVHERRFWGDYMRAYEEAIRATASKHAPWFRGERATAPPMPIPKTLCLSVQARVKRFLKVLFRWPVVYLFRHREKEEPSCPGTGEAWREKGRQGTLGKAEP